MSELKDVYDRLYKILGESIEPFGSVDLVDRYRKYFKPDNVRTILLAESHVFTSDIERMSEVAELSDLPGCPREYAKFVYCLAYGEEKLVESKEKIKNSGSPQFWKVLFSCCNSIKSIDDFSPVLKKTQFDKRIENKLKTLKTLREMGVWLVDASVVALYHNGKKSPMMRDALKASWDLYTKNIVLSSEPENIICIGKGVAKVVERDLNKYFQNRYTVLEQPNAFLSSSKHLENFKVYNEICMRGHV